MNATLPFPIYTPASEALSPLPQGLEVCQVISKESVAVKPFRVLILSSLTGWGHKKVADALQLAFQQHPHNDARPIEVHVENVLEASNIFNRSLSKIYNVFLRYAQSWMFLYYHTINALNLSCQPVVLEPMMPYAERLLQTHQPDVLVSVHPMMQYFGGMLQRANQKLNGVSLPFYTMVTDPCYGFWKGWTHPSVTHYFTATPEASQQLKAYGVSLHHITQIGLPNSAEQERYSDAEKDALRQSVFGEKSKRLSLLFNAGWAGGGGIESLLKGFVEKASPEMLGQVNLIFQAGSHPALKQRLQELAQATPELSIYVCSVEQDMPPLYALADAIITKPGASTVFEALHHGVPVLIDAQKRLMPQEEGTARWIQKIGVGASLPDVNALLALVETWLQTPQSLQALQAQTPKWQIPNASVRFVESLLQALLKESL